jgi:putative transposase
MPRPRRAAAGGLIYDALSWANAQLAFFDSDADYAAFERVLRQAVARFDIRLVAYCLMPSHFHLPLWPREHGDRSAFMRWLTNDPHPTPLSIFFA